MYVCIVIIHLTHSQTSACMILTQISILFNPVVYVRIELNIHGNIITRDILVNTKMSQVIIFAAIISSTNVATQYSRINIHVYQVVTLNELSSHLNYRGNCSAILYVNIVNLFRALPANRQLESQIGCPLVEISLVGNAVGGNSERYCSR